MEKITGKCHCGKVTYTSEEEGKFKFRCFCNTCRKMNGGGHLAAMTLNKESFTFEGSPKIYEYTGGSGKNLKAHFCDNCGTPMFNFSEAHPEVVIIRANTLDNEEDFEPLKDLFVEEAWSWDKPNS